MRLKMRMNIPATLKNCKQTASVVPIDLKIMDRGQSSTGTKRLISVKGCHSFKCKTEIIFRLTKTKLSVIAMSFLN